MQRAEAQLPGGAAGKYTETALNTYDILAGGVTTFIIDLWKLLPHTPDRPIARVFLALTGSNSSAVAYMLYLYEADL